MGIFPLGVLQGLQGLDNDSMELSTLFLMQHRWVSSGVVV